MIAPLTIPAAAAQLGISRASMYRLVRRGAIPYLLFPVGGVRIEPDALEQFKARCRRNAIAKLLPTRPARARHITDLAARTKRIALVSIGRSQ